VVEGVPLKLPRLRCARPPIPDIILQPEQKLKLRWDWRSSETRFALGAEQDFGEPSARGLRPSSAEVLRPRAQSSRSATPGQQLPFLYCNSGRCLDTTNILSNYAQIAHRVNSPLSVSYRPKLGCPKRPMTSPGSAHKVEPIFSTLCSWV
jgi:hypothetical protein